MVNPLDRAALASDADVTRQLAEWNPDPEHGQPPDGGDQQSNDQQDLADLGRHRSRIPSPLAGARRS